MTAFHSLISSSFGPQAEREMVYIGELGVAPQAQGSGLGRAMVRAVLDREQQRQRACREEGQKGGSDVILFTAAERSVSCFLFGSARFQFLPKSAWERYRAPRHCPVSGVGCQVSAVEHSAISSGEIVVILLGWFALTCFSGCRDRS